MYRAPLSSLPFSAMSSHYPPPRPIYSVCATLSTFTHHYHRPTLVSSIPSLPSSSSTTLGCHNHSSILPGPSSSCRHPSHLLCSLHRQVTVLGNISSRSHCRYSAAGLPMPCVALPLSCHAVPWMKKRRKEKKEGALMCWPIYSMISLFSQFNSNPKFRTLYPKSN